MQAIYDYKTDTVYYVSPHLFERLVKWAEQRGRKIRIVNLKKINKDVEPTVINTAPRYKFYAILNKAQMANWLKLNDQLEINSSWSKRRKSLDGSLGIIEFNITVDEYSTIPVNARGKLYPKGQYEFLNPSNADSIYTIHDYLKDNKLQWEDQSQA